MSLNADVPRYLIDFIDVRMSLLTLIHMLPLHVAKSNVSIENVSGAHIKCVLESSFTKSFSGVNVRVVCHFYNVGRQHMFIRHPLTLLSWHDQRLPTNISTILCLFI